jgi:elongation factor P
MIKAGQIAKGSCLIWKGEPHLVTEREFVNPGKGAAFVRVKLKHLTSGSVLRETIKTSESVEEADVFDRDAQYLYADDAAYHFMDAENYEQFTVPRAGLEEKGYFMKEGETYRIVMWESAPIDVTIPLKIVLEVTEAQEGVRGDTVTGATKPVVTQTGFEVRVPIFIKQGDKILVNTESGEYVERVNE